MSTFTIKKTLRSFKMLQEFYASTKSKVIKANNE